QVLNHWNTPQMTTRPMTMGCRMASTKVLRAIVRIWESIETPAGALGARAPHEAGLIFGRPRRTRPAPRRSETYSGGPGFAGIGALASIGRAGGGRPIGWGRSEGERRETRRVDRSGDAPDNRPAMCR